MYFFGNVLPVLLFVALFVLPLCYVWRLKTDRWLGVCSVLLLSWVGYILFRYTLPSTRHSCDQGN